MTTPNFTPDFTKTGDVFVSRDGTELTFLCDDNDANNDPPIKLGRKGDHYWLYRNGRVFTHREHRMDIVSQYTPTTAPQGVDVPMGGDFHAFARAQSEWSQATFGTDQQRGPIGPLKHLEKEAREAQENPTDIYEFVDCLFLTLDASRRAGFSSESLLHFAWEKLTINKSRDWPKVTDTLQDRVKELAERDATIVELRAEVERLKQWELYAWRVIGNLEDAADGRPVEVEEGKSPHPTIKTIDALRTRAEAAEAKVAELELRLANVDKVAVHACDVRDDSIADLELRLATSTESMYVNMKAANEANAQLAAANERVAELEGESKGWHGVVVECEKILKAVGTAEKPLTSNLPNLIRDRLQNLHRAEEQLAELRSTSTIHERDMHAALARITDATARIAKVFGEQIGHGLPIDGPGGCVQWALDGYAKLRAENERLVERFERAKKLLLGYRGWFVRSGRIDVNQQSEIYEIDQAIAAGGGGK